MGRLLFYGIAGSVIAGVSLRLGAGISLTFLLSLVGPPTILMAVRLYQYSRL